jgi:hypothetical protein
MTARLPAPSYWVLATGYWQPAPRPQLPAPSDWLPATGYRL